MSLLLLFSFFSHTQCQHISIEVVPVLLLWIDGLAVIVSIRSWLVKIRFHISYKKGKEELLQTKEKTMSGDNGNQGKL